MSAKKVALHVKKKLTNAAKPRQSLMLKKVAKPSIAEVQDGNDRVLSSSLMAGQHRFSRMVETSDGLQVMSHRLREAKATQVLVHPMPVEIRRHRSQWVDGKLIPFPAEIDCGPLPEPPVDVASVDIHAPEPTLAQLRMDYESGLSLDAICRRYRIGKSRVSRLLAEAGTKMRAPGRKPRPPL